MEKTYIMLKPDAYKRGLVGEIVSRIEKKALKIVKMHLRVLSKEVVGEHYAHLKDRPEIYNSLLEYMTSGPVLCMVVAGHDAVTVMRLLMGPTDASKAPGGTIRGDFANSITCNIIHGSDSVESAEIEIARFFG